MHALARTHSAKLARRRHISPPIVRSKSAVARACNRAARPVVAAAAAAASTAFAGLISALAGWRALASGAADGRALGGSGRLAPGVTLRRRLAEYSIELGTKRGGSRAPVHLAAAPPTAPVCLRASGPPEAFGRPSLRERPAGWRRSAGARRLR